jgi:hypothetical protein
MGVSRGQAEWAAADPTGMMSGQPICVSKGENHSKIHRCQVRSSFGGQGGAQAMKRPQEILSYFQGL